MNGCDPAILIGNDVEIRNSELSGVIGDHSRIEGSNGYLTVGASTVIKNSAFGRLWAGDRLRLDSVQCPDCTLFAGIGESLRNYDPQRVSDVSFSNIDVRGNASIKVSMTGASISGLRLVDSSNEPNNGGLDEPFRYEFMTSTTYAFSPTQTYQAHWHSDREASTRPISIRQASDLDPYRAP